MSMQRISYRRSGFRSSCRGLWFILTLLCLLLLFSMRGYADTVDLSVTYGYQNTAKAGRRLPLSIGIENHQESTFSGYIHVYMVESEDSVYEYRYQKIVEGGSSDTLNVTVSLSSGISQLLVTAEDREGHTLGSRRIGLDVAGSDAELIIGIISDHPEALSYLNDVGINNGILRTRSVILPVDDLPDSENELDQLDVLLISDFSMKNIRKNEAEVIAQWVRDGGILLLGTGARGEDALSPYYAAYLRAALQPAEMSLEMGTTYHEGEDSPLLSLTASPVHIKGGQEVMLSDGVPIVSAVSEGAGIVAISGYDFCDLTRFATEQSGFIDQLFSAILGKTRLEKLSVTASERSLARYWNVQELMNLSDLRKVPQPILYAMILASYVLLIGPGLYFFLRERDVLRMYRPGVLLVTAMTIILVYVMGLGTRLMGPFLTCVRLKNISADSVDETDYLNLRSPYFRSYELPVKTEYDVYPILKGADFTGDIQGLLSSEDYVSHTSIDNGREKKTITIQNAAPFAARYFELHNNMPNADGSFQSDIHFADGSVHGTLTNGTAYDLSDAALLIYGKVIRIGRLDAGASIELGHCEVVNVPVGDSRKIAASVTSGTWQGLLRYYLTNSLSGYFSDARIVGCVREENPEKQPLDFTEQTDIDSYGFTMVVSSLPLSTRVGDVYSYSALSTDPKIQSGDYDATENTVASAWPTTLEYHLGEGSDVTSLTIESLSADDAGDTKSIGSVRPFRGSMSFYNYATGGFDVIDIGNGVLTRAQLDSYLDEDNVLIVRYTSSEENAGIDERRYLPMLTVTARNTEEKPVEMIDAAELEAAGYIGEDSVPEETEPGIG